MTAPAQYLSPYRSLRRNTSTHRIIEPTISHEKGGGRGKEEEAKEEAGEEREMCVWDMRRRAQDIHHTEMIYELRARVVGRKTRSVGLAMNNVEMTRLRVSVFRPSPWLALTYIQY